MQRNRLSSATFMVERKLPCGLEETNTREWTNKVARAAFLWSTWSCSEES
jgi:hypothetical protein